MARPLRIEFAGALYHVTSRGDRRGAIYEDDEDREAFLGVLAEVVERFNWIGVHLATVGRVVRAAMQQCENPSCTIVQGPRHHCSPSAG